MGNRKAMFASVFIVLLLGICLVPAFAEDNVATGKIQMPPWLQTS